ncbi:7853_t:CDS:2, partial [Ambispora gerdemannii]
KLENCKGRVVTIFLDGLHHLQKFVDHNHSPQASSAEEIHPYIPSHNALRVKIKCARRTEIPPQLKTLDEINIPDSLHSTLGGDLFLVRDSIINQE